MDEQNNFIELLEQKKKEVSENNNSLAILIESLLSVFERYYSSDKTFVKKAERLGQYTNVLLKVKKDKYPTYSRCSTKEIAEDVTFLIDSVITEVRTMGLPVQQTANTVSRNININNTLTQSQEQSQEQDLIVNILLEAIKDDLTGKQRKEILEVARDAKTTKEAHQGIMEKLKEFGSDISASIVANILTNPQVWDVLGSIV